MKLCAIPAAVVALLAGAVTAGAAEHVRVVLDVSSSMAANDPGRLALLSTALLHDLARPNPSLGDSFEVLPFDQNWVWRSPADPPPETMGTRVLPQPDRAAFLRHLLGLDYTARMTYFYPGLKQAIEDLEALPRHAHDVRVVVLVTDGLPERHVREHEARLLRERLVPRLEAGGMRLYVLAFGKQAFDHRGFFDQLVVGDGGARLGEVFVDRDGSRMLAHMLQIFSRSFGYAPDVAHQLPVARLDLEGGTTPERVAAVVLAEGQSKVPSLRLRDPAGGGINAPEGVRGAKVPGAGYAQTWVLSPTAGFYEFDTDVLRGTVAVLRPTKLRLEILPTPPARQALRTMAETPFALRVLVQPPAGATGDPGPVEISFRPNGRRVGSEYEWVGDLGAPPAGPGDVRPEGRVYEIEVEFPRQPEPEEEFYGGYLEVEARRGEAVVGSLVGPHAYRLDVYAPLSIVPSPSLGDAVPSASSVPQALAAREQGCARFALDQDSGRLPHPDDPHYPVRSVLDLPAPTPAPLNEATFTLDGLPLEPADRPRSQPGEWYLGRELSREELLGNHRICVRVGRPKTGNPGQPLSLPVRFTLMESPYDDFGVIRDFAFKVVIRPPGLLERWRSLIALILTPLLVLAGLWYLRGRPDFPDDLRVSLARGGSPDRLQPVELGEGSLLARLFGLVRSRALAVPGEGRRLGWLRPVDDELFKLRPVRGGVVEDPESGDRLPARARQVSLAAHRTYRLRIGEASYWVRLEYR